MRPAWIKSLLGDQQGTALIEYSILLGIVSAALLVSVLAIAVWTEGQLTSVHTALAGDGAANSVGSGNGNGNGAGGNGNGNHGNGNGNGGGDGSNAGGNGKGKNQ